MDELALLSALMGLLLAFIGAAPAGLKLVAWYLPVVAVLSLIVGSMAGALQQPVLLAVCLAIGAGWSVLSANTRIPVGLLACVGLCAWLPLGWALLAASGCALLSQRVQSIGLARSRGHLAAGVVALVTAAATRLAIEGLRLDAPLTPLAHILLTTIAGGAVLFGWTWLRRGITGEVPSRWVWVALAGQGLILLSMAASPGNALGSLALDWGGQQGVGKVLVLAVFAAWFTEIFYLRRLPWVSLILCGLALPALYYWPPSAWLIPGFAAAVILLHGQSGNQRSSAPPSSTKPIA